jgi:hypothetical protein
MRNHAVVISLKREGYKPALALIWRVFLEFEAPALSKEGIDTFKAFIAYEGIIKKIAIQKIV